MARLTFNHHARFSSHWIPLADSLILVPKQKRRANRYSILAVVLRKSLGFADGPGKSPIFPAYVLHRLEALEESVTIETLGSGGHIWRGETIRSIGAGE